MSFISPAANGALYTNLAVDYGWYRGDGVHAPGNHNYRVGFNTLDNLAYRNFFVFDLSRLPAGTINSAILTLYNGQFGYSGTGDTYQLGSVSTPINSLRDGSAGLGAFNDLAAGTPWSTRHVSSADNNTTINMSLNQAFNSNAGLLLGNGSLAIGGFFVGDTGGPPVGSLFVQIQLPTLPTPSLILNITEIPEPSLLPLSVAFLLFTARRRFLRTR